MVGVSEYPDPNQRLPAVAADVREMAKILSSKHGGFPNGVTVLADQQATRDKILSELRAVFSSAANEAVFAYLAGHGMVVGGQYFFVAHDTKDEHSAVPLTEIRALFDQAKCRRVFLWLDFCHAGGILARGQQTDDMAAIRRSLGAAGGHGKVIVAACAPAQSAHESAALGHGLFTEALLRGLGGDAKSSHGDVTALSLYEFVVREVKHPAQQPVFLGEMAGVIVLTHYPERTSPATKPAVKAKLAASKSKSVSKKLGTWVMLGDDYFLSDGVRHRSDNKLEIKATATTDQAAAVFAALRPGRYGGRSSLPFAAENDAQLVRVESVESESAGRGQVWTLILSVEEIASNELDATYSVNGKTYTPEDIARLRAGLMLLNDPAPRVQSRRGFDANDSIQSWIEGSGRYPVKVCVIREAFGSHGSDSNWRTFARLRAIFLLKAAGIVEHVHELTIGAMRNGSVPVTFRGQRRARYSGTAPEIIELKGLCPLEDR